MENELLIPEERLNAVIRCESPDRVPCAPWIESYAARFTGMNNHEFYFDSRKAFGALAAVKERFPVWDIRRSQYYQYYGPCVKAAGHLKNKIPGVDLPPDYELQFIEFEAMERKDYSILLEQGPDAYFHEFYKRILSSSEEQIAAAMIMKEELQREELEQTRRLGQVYLYGAAVAFSADSISFLRSFNEFIRDIYQIPDIMEEVISVTTEASIEAQLQIARKTGIPRIFVGLARMSGQFFSDRIFERFVWPFLNRYINRFIDEGMTPILHLDGDWGRNLHYFLDIPAGKVIIELDGCTDIFRAKKTLGGHVCLLGDVPSTLFAVGTPEKVTNYCRRLIAEVGEGGGFILGSGCYLPHQADHRNVEAFFNSVAG